MMIILWTGVTKACFRLQKCCNSRVPVFNTCIWILQKNTDTVDIVCWLYINMGITQAISI